MPLFQLQLELPSSQINEFHQFLLYHKKIKSFQKTDNKFSLCLASSLEEYEAFLKGLQEIFSIGSFKESRLCQAKCRDQTDCLNSAKHGKYCWRHAL